MALQKYVSQGDAPSVGMKPLHISSKAQGNADIVDSVSKQLKAPYVNIDLTEVYFLIMHFLSAGPCQRTCGQLWNELLEHQLLPRRYHGWYSRSGKNSGDENDDGISFPLSYSQLVERYPHVEKDHLVQLLTQLLINKVHRPGFVEDCEVPNAAHVPTILGRGSFSLLGDDDQTRVREKHPPAHMRWPHMRADQVHGLCFREIGGGFPKHLRPPSIRAACYAIAKPSMVVHKMEHIKKLRGHRNAVYCATYDRLGRYVITGSDDRLVKIWSMETAFCLASCRGHEGDITDLAVSLNNAVVASASNDCVIRVWHVPDGMPVSVLRGHTAAVTAIAFCPRPGSLHQLLSSSDDGTCRLWDARDANINPRIFVPRPAGNSGKMDGASTSAGQESQHQIFCCAFNSSGTVFVTGSSDNRARVWNACKPTSEDSNQPTHEMDVLAGHENDVNYVQFSGCAVASKVSVTDGIKEESVYKFRNSWFSHENIVTCSRDGSATIFTPRSRRSHGKARWVKQFHLKVPPPPMPPQPPRGPRQRILPTPRGVNMIIWSLDNRFVLAAIMDCRICVWNAADGEVVHTLTGHTASTYVLDVHPLNPRIAMSAGYDGKTIVWDIWEGQPIRIYEISPYKLVDGKFSPVLSLGPFAEPPIDVPRLEYYLLSGWRIRDGTSIILSDDVGQLHFLSTGQGESQKDAQYDQFFLGDYRPLIQDSSGHVLDQETQLAPYRRNMLDLLCDSGMIPYEEPYQSMYQRRRLGALGLEWNPSSLKLAAGPDFSLDPQYHLMPLGDLDFFVEPLPEFVDAMEWEPDIDVRSDDTDSEYNVTDGYSSGAEHGSFEFCSSDSAEEAEVKEKDSSRRSKRKKQKSEIEVMTSSERRAKKRNLDESDGNPLKSNRSKNLRVGRRGLKKKYSKSNSSRPRRAAARNALNMFSKITEIATDEEEEDDYGSESDFSETESSLPDSNIESDGMDESVQKERHRHLKGKEISAENSQSMINATELPNFHARGRKRIILKLSSKFGIYQSALNKDDNGVDNVGSSFKASQPESDANGAPTGFQMRGYLGDASHNQSEDEGRYLNLQGLSKRYHNGDIKWGGGKVRSSKRQRLGEGMTSAPYFKSTLCLKDPREAVGQLEDGLQCEKDHPSIDYILEGKQNADMADEVATEDGINHAHGNFGVKDDVVDAKRARGLNGDSDFDQSPNVDQMMDQNYGEYAKKGDISPVPTKFRIRARNVTKESSDNQTCDASFSNTTEKRTGVNEHDMNNGHILEREGYVFGDSCGKVKGHVSHPNGVSGSNSNPKRMYSVVYKRSKQSRGKANWERDDDGRVSTSSASACNYNISSKNLLSEAMKSEASGPHSVSFSVPACGYEAPQNGNCESQEVTEVDDEFVNTSNFLESSRQPCEEGGSSSRIAVRSSRRRRSSYRPRDLVPVDQEKSHRQGKAGSWFMLPAHVEGSHYIPQLGDELAYLRQGHQEYLEFSGSKEASPWRFVKGNVRTVEFCKVVKLEYDTLAGSGDRCCKMTLQFVDPTSSMLGKNFKLTLPEVTGFPDFLVERSRYDTAMQRDWACRDKCKVWWESAGEEAKGGWWDGRIKSIEPKSSEFPDSPWERYTLSYKSDPKENHKHSPWELFDDNDESGLGQPHLDDETKKKLLAALVKLEQSGNKSADYYGVQHLRQVSQKPNFANRFPVPLTVDVILSRVKNDYYRSLDAVRHDIEVMVSNVVSYSNKSAVLAKVQRLSEFLAETLNSL